jgi:hypothetical protein
LEADGRRQRLTARERIREFWDRGDERPIRLPFKPNIVRGENGPFAQVILYFVSRVRAVINAIAVNEVLHRSNSLLAKTRKSGKRKRKEAGSWEQRSRVKFQVLPAFAKAPARQADSTALRSE